MEKFSKPKERLPSYQKVFTQTIESNDEYQVNIQTLNTIHGNNTNQGHFFGLDVLHFENGYLEVSLNYFGRKYQGVLTRKTKES